MLNFADELGVDGFVLSAVIDFDVEATLDFLLKRKIEQMNRSENNCKDFFYSIYRDADGNVFVLVVVVVVVIVILVVVAAVAAVIGFLAFNCVFV